MVSARNNINNAKKVYMTIAVEKTFFRLATLPRPSSNVKKRCVPAFNDPLIKVNIVTMPPTTL